MERNEAVLLHNEVRCWIRSFTSGTETTLKAGRGARSIYREVVTTTTQPAGTGLPST